MRWIALVVLAGLACKKSEPQGLPPAKDWSGSGGPASPAPQPQAGAPQGDLPPGHPPTGDQLPPGHPPTGDQLPPGHPATGDQPPAGVPAGHPPMAGSGTGKAKTLAKLPGGKLALGPYALAVPAGWTEVPTTSDMRAAQFSIGKDAELVVYYFGEQGAGDTQANLDRWIGQFTQPGGKPSKDVAKIEHPKILGSEATIVTVTGHYTAMAMGQGESVDKDDQMLLAAITGSPSGPYYWKLVGSKATVTANTAKFRSMISSLALAK